jgi:hypothetical protein
MKVIDIGVCIDNNDPKGLGRIRVIDYDDYVGGKSNIKENYQKWGKDDPFLALPFLPNNINFIPEIKQTVKILRYDTDKTTVNQEYIAGPFTTRFDFNSQTFNEQIADTTYGVSIKPKDDIIKNEEGELPENSKNALSKYRDYSVSGKYGSDTVYTENGVVLRGGKLISKSRASKSERELISKGFPLMSKKVAKIHLKKFSEKKTLVEEVVEEKVVESKRLKFIIEYDVDNLNNPQFCNFYVYQISPNFSVPKYDSNNFTESTEILPSEVVFLSESGNTYTFRIDLNDVSGFSGSTLNNKINQTYLSIRNSLIDIHKNGFGGLISYNILSNLIVNNVGTFNPTNLIEIHPFYFRPTFEFKNRVVSNTEFNNRNVIFSKIMLTSKTSPGSGLVYDKERITPPERVIEKVNTSLKTDNTVKEQTFGNITADKIYLLSTDTNLTDKPIDFSTLNSYEYTQEDYVEKIDPNTYSFVRGEILLEFIDAVYKVLTTHVHNINKPYVKNDYDAHTEMDRLYNKLRQDLINTSIKLN